MDSNKKPNDTRKPHLSLTREAIKSLLVQTDVKAGRAEITFNYCHSVQFGC